MYSNKPHWSFNASTARHYTKRASIASLEWITEAIRMQSLGAINAVKIKFDMIRHTPFLEVTGILLQVKDRPLLRQYPLLLVQQPLPIPSTAFPSPRSRHLGQSE
jgi:hypothetical protein